MLYTIKNDKLSAKIDTLGAQLRQISASDGHEYMWCADERIWDGTAPILFPVVGRVKGGSYFYEDKEYKMTIHGFAMEKEFSLVQNSGDNIVLALESDESTKAVFPFDFRLEIRFSLSGSKLLAEHTVINKGMGDMYFSIGAHPAFACDIGDTLVFEKKENIKAHKLENDLLGPADADFLTDENEWTIKADSFDDDAYILNGLASRKVTLKRRDGRNVTFRFDAPYLGIWAKPGASYVCIEPWFGVDESAAHDRCLVNRPGIVKLAQNGSFTLWYEAELF